MIYLTILYWLPSIVGAISKPFNPDIELSKLIWTNFMSFMLVPWFLAWAIVLKRI